MQDLGEVIGDNRVLERRFSSRYGQLSTELWDATLKRLDFDDDDYEDEGSQRRRCPPALDLTRADGHLCHYTCSGTELGSSRPR